MDPYIRVGSMLLILFILTLRDLGNPIVLPRGWSLRLLRHVELVEGSDGVVKGVEKGFEDFLGDELAV